VLSMFTSLSQAKKQLIKDIIEEISPYHSP